MVGDVDVLAVADHEEAAGAAQHRGTLGGRPALADEVEHGLGAVSARQVEDLLHMCSVGDDADVGAHLLREFHRSGFRSTTTIRSAEIADSTWIPMCPQTSCADDHARVAGSGHPRDLRDRVIGGQAASASAATSAGSRESSIFTTLRAVVLRNSA